MLIGIMKVLLWLVSLMLIGVILLQTSRGAGMASVFGGGGGADSLLGTRTTSFLTRATAVLAALFLVLSISLGRMSGVRAYRSKYVKPAAEAAGKAAARKAVPAEENKTSKTNAGKTGTPKAAAEGGKE